jgi:uncharacterized protein DUF3467
MNHSDDQPASGKPSEGRYANFFSVGHNAFEFLLDFGQSLSEGGTPTLHTRIITNPIYAKVLMGALTESINSYEKSFGPIGQDDGEVRSNG